MNGGFISQYNTQFPNFYADNSFQHVASLNSSGPIQILCDQGFCFYGWYYCITTTLIDVVTIFNSSKTSSKTNAYPTDQANVSFLVAPLAGTRNIMVLNNTSIDLTNLRFKFWS